jgi:hypothetical protein
MRYCVNGKWVDGSSKPLRTLPIQVTQRCMGDSEIPAEIVEEAYKEYAARYGTAQSLERLCERGGFGVAELARLLYDRIKRIETERRGS